MDIIAAIDAVTGCQQCGRTLEGSVSDDFCGERCQRTWAANRVGVPVHDPILDSADRAALARVFAQLMPTAEQCGEAFRQFGEALRREDDQPFQRLYLNQPRRFVFAADAAIEAVPEHVDLVADELNVPRRWALGFGPSEHAQ